MYDILIIGAGPIGMTCAIEAEKAGLKYIIIEKGVLVNSLYHFPINMTFFSTSKKLEIGGIPFLSHNEKPTRREALEYYRRVYEEWNLKVQFYDKVLNVSKLYNDIFQIKTSKNTYQSKNIILVTGFYDLPNKLKIKGADLPKVKHYYNDWHPYINQKIAVIGAANSACDVALELYHKGAEVTMIIREESISPRVKYWIKPNIENRIKEGSIRAFYNSNLTEITEHEVTFQTPEKEVTIPNNFVLAMTGYVPDYSFFEKIGIEFQEDEYRTPIHDSETLETNIPNLYIAGVITAGKHTSKFFIENTRNHAAMIFKKIMKNNNEK